VVESRDVVGLGTVETSSKGADVHDVDEPATDSPVQAANTTPIAKSFHRILTCFI
jgi:hypothetical protein